MPFEASWLHKCKQCRAAATSAKIFSLYTLESKFSSSATKAATAAPQLMSPAVRKTTNCFLSPTFCFGWTEAPSFGSFHDYRFGFWSHSCDFYCSRGIMKEVLLLRPPLLPEQLMATTNFILPSVLFRILVRVRSHARIHLLFLPFPPAPTTLRCFSSGSLFYL